MAKSVISTDSLYSSVVKIKTLTPFSSIQSQVLEPLFPVPLSSFKSTIDRTDDVNSKVVNISNGLSVFITQSATDGQAISTSSGGGEYWITG